MAGPRGFSRTLVRASLGALMAVVSQVAGAAPSDVDWGEVSGPSLAGRLRADADTAISTLQFPSNADDGLGGATFPSTRLDHACGAGVEAEGGTGVSKVIERCDTGGWATSECNVYCHKLFNFWTATCEVSCRSGYYACCSCDEGCRCIIDHDEMWPSPSDPK